MRTTPLPEIPQNNRDLYPVQNIYEAAYLLSRGIKLVGKEKHGNKIVVFFESKDAQAEAMRFYNGAKIEAKAYSDSYRCLKDHIFER